jgi:hypothetical protein
VAGADEMTGTDAVSAGGALAAAILRVLRQPIWLPRGLYAAVPWIYLGCGTGALLGGVFLPDPTWFLPYLLLLGVACLHAAAALASLRRGRVAASPGGLSAASRPDAPATPTMGAKLTE